MADWMRNTVESTLGPGKAFLQVRQEHRTPTGGTTYTWTDGPWSYCAIASMSHDELEMAGAMGLQANVSCRVGADLDVDPEHRIRVEGSGADELEGVWQVKSILAGHPFTDRLLYLARIT
jgi:head-tail adaptor